MGTWIAQIGPEGPGGRAPSMSDVPYDAGNFSAIGASVWTVGPWAILSYEYIQIGNRLQVNIAIDGSTLAGGPCVWLEVQIPVGGLTIKRYVFGTAHVIIDANPQEIIEYRASPGETRLLFRRLGALLWTPPCTIFLAAQSKVTLQ